MSPNPCLALIQRYSHVFLRAFEALDPQPEPRDIGVHARTSTSLYTTTSTDEQVFPELIWTT